MINLDDPLPSGGGPHMVCVSPTAFKSAARLDTPCCRPGLRAMDAWKQHVREFSGNSHEFLLFPVVVDQDTLSGRAAEEVRVAHIQRCHSAVVQHTLSRVGRGKLRTLGGAGAPYAEMTKRRATVSSSVLVPAACMACEAPWRVPGFEQFPHPPSFATEGDVVSPHPATSLLDGFP